MSSSLAEQLQRLALPAQSHGASTTLDKKRVSLLFDPKEAAGIRKETFYQIGLDGFNDLLAKNSAFEAFTNTLFHYTSKDFERSVQTAESNEKLDKQIKKFILQLSPYFLLNCSHKALEWLVQRFSVHTYNRNDLLMLILPYHESNIFVRVVQILKFEETSDPFFFLKALQKPGVHLPKQALLNHAANEVYFIKFVANFILDIVTEVPDKPGAVAFNFYCSVFTGCIEYTQGPLREDQISQMLPALLKGLSSPNIDFVAATYVIIARLVAKTTLSDKLITKFVDKIAMLPVLQLKTEAVLLLIVLSQTQTMSENVFSEKALEKICEHEWFPQVLHSLSHSGCYVYPLLERLLVGNLNMALKSDNEKHRNFVSAILNQLDNDLVGNVFDLILDNINPKKKKSYTPSNKEWLTKIIQDIERQYPTEFDKKVCHILASKNDTRRPQLTYILDNTLRTKYELFEKLYHPNAEIRSHAVKFLSTQTLKENERELVVSSFIDRLGDENVEVVKDALLVVQKTNLIKREELKKILFELLHKFNDFEANADLIQLILEVLCSENNQDYQILIAVFPFLITKKKKSPNKTLKLVQKSQFGTAFSDVFVPNITDLSETLLIKNLLKLDFNQLMFAISKLPQKNTLFAFTSIFLINKTMPDSVTLETAMTSLEIMTKLAETLTPKNASQTDLFNLFKMAKNCEISIQFYLNCVIQIPETIQVCQLYNALCVFDDTSNPKLYTLIMIILLQYFDTYPAPLFKFMDAWLEQTHICSILLNLSIVKDVTRLNALKALTQIVHTYAYEVIDMNTKIMPVLLVALSKCDTVDTRHQMFETIEKILEHSQPGEYYLLLEGLLRQKSEIIMDLEQLPLVIYNILSSNKKSDKAILKDIQEMLFQSIVDYDSLPIYVMSGMLTVMSMVDSYTHYDDYLSSLGDEMLSNLKYTKSSKLDIHRSTIIQKLIERFDSKASKQMTVKSGVFSFVKQMLQRDDNCLASGSAPAVYLLNHIDSDTINCLQNDVKQMLLDLIIDVSTTSTNPEILIASNRVFKYIDLDSGLVLDALKQMKEVQTQKQLDLSKKKRRVSVVPTLDVLDTLEWKKGLRVLEVIQNKKKLTNTHVILPVLFDILKKCLNFDEQAIVEYPKQLVLSSILHCSLKVTSKLPDNVFNVELVVQCIRASQNPQTHHHALLVLSHMSTLVPNQVLHHIMAIFTFMGSSVLRHDDAYSFQLITNIVDTIIPLLVNQENRETIVTVLRVFVDVILDVPEHRKKPLYVQLLTRINAQDNLYLFLLLIFESYVTHTDKKRLDITANLVCEFNPTIVLETCIKLMVYLKDLPLEKDDITSNATEVNLSHLTQKQFRHYKYTLVTFMSNLLSSQEFVNQIALLPNDDLLQMEESYKNMIINILGFIQRTSVISEQYSDSAQAQYWKILLHHTYDILDSLNALLTPEMFLLVTKGLINHKLSNVRRRSLELLNNKLQHNPTFFSACARNDLMSLVKPLTSLVTPLTSSDDAQQDDIIIQTALLSLKLIVKLLGQGDPQKFIELLDFVTQTLKSGKVQQANVLASLVLCLAEICVNIRAHAISELPNFMPMLLKHFKQAKNDDTPSLLLLSLITAIHKILDALPMFLSPYLQKLLVELSQLITKWGNDSNDPKLAPFAAKLTAMKQKIGASIPSRLLIPAIESSYLNLVEKNKFTAVGALMDVFTENLSHLKGVEINSNLPELSKFFLNALQFRDSQQCDLDDANLVENHVIKALVTLILKLSETNFRPFYYKLYEWAIRSEAKNDRIITFYNLSREIAANLKSLFVLFAGHFVNNAAQVVDLCNASKNTLYFTDNDKNILLLESVLQTLTFIFKFDTLKFVNKDRFDVLMQPLVDQLENNLGGLDSLIQRNRDVVTPCLVQFAIATADDSLWKQMNYQILLKMRNSSPEIRLIALHCLSEVVKHLGDDFLPLLPETIPFLAELLEDDEELVEKGCKLAVQEMEKILGEPLHKYF